MKVNPISSGLDEAQPPMGVIINEQTFGARYVS
jgi:hypothetical protein